MATNHLIDLGHTNIAFIGGDIEHPSWIDRLKGYKQALENAGIPLKHNLIVTNDKYQGRQSGFNLGKKIIFKKK